MYARTTLTHKQSLRRCSFTDRVCVCECVCLTPPPPPFVCVCSGVFCAGVSRGGPAAVVCVWGGGLSCRENNTILWIGLTLNPLTRSTEGVLQNVSPR